jgi:hypothetical protein
LRKNQAEPAKFNSRIDTGRFNKSPPGKELIFSPEKPSEEDQS